MFIARLERKRNGPTEGSERRRRPDQAVEHERSLEKERVRQRERLGIEAGEKERVREREVGQRRRHEDEKIRAEGNLYCKM